VVKSINPEAIIIGEIWDDASRWLEGDQFDAVMNYRFAYASVDFFIDRDRDAASFDRELADVRADYAPEVNEIMQNLFDSHDTDRLASMIANPGRRYDNQNGPGSNPTYSTRKPSADHRKLQKLMALFQMTYVGAPMVYYGTESGMWGADDPDDRKPMVWDDLTYEPESTLPNSMRHDPDTVSFDHDIHNWYRKVIGVRNRLEPLRRGSMETLLADGDLFAFRRTFGKGHTVVVFNRGAGSTASLPLKGEWRDELTGQKFSGTDGSLVVHVEQVSGRILVPVPPGTPR
ncbi:MAG: alpha-amylase family glycosyl hydrolase, partial [Bacteroidota bacterium]